MKQLLADIAEDKGFYIKGLEIMPDQVHVFVSAHPKFAPGYIYKSLKGIYARKLFLEFPEMKQKLLEGRLWNSAIYIETTGQVSEGTVQKYIEEQ